MPPRVDADWFIDGRDVHTSQDLIPGITPDIQRYYLHYLEPGDYVETIIAVTRAGMRRFFITWLGERLEEVGEEYFIRYRELETRCSSNSTSRRCVPPRRN